MRLPMPGYGIVENVCCKVPVSPLARTSNKNVKIHLGMCNIFLLRMGLVKIEKGCLKPTSPFPQPLLCVTPPKKGPLEALLLLLSFLLTTPHPSSIFFSLPFLLSNPSPFPNPPFLFPINKSIT